MSGVGHAAEADTGDAAAIHRGGRRDAVASEDADGGHIRMVGSRAVSHQAECVVGFGSQTVDSVGGAGDTGGDHAGVAQVVDGVGSIAVAVVSPCEGGRGQGNTCACKIGGHHTGCRSGKGDGGHG